MRSKTLAWRDLLIDPQGNQGHQAAPGLSERVRRAKALDSARFPMAPSSSCCGSQTPLEEGLTGSILGRYHLLAT
jgi:hypothetical protein